MLTSGDHLDWFDDNVAWFAQRRDALGVDVPRCPGWTVEHVLDHLSVGMGLGYEAAARTPPDATARTPSAERLTGADAVATFEQTMARCIGTLRALGPATPCWTYAGPGVVAFWMRRAAIETALHRIDVAHAIGGDPSDGMGDDRIVDAVDETVSFALPLAGRWTHSSPPSITVRLDDLDASFALGAGTAVGTVHGDGLQVLDALWGRTSGSVSIDGAAAAAHAWLGLVETAFAGR
jgi:uncharacterized protein (TIGR03083 family)